MSNKVLTKTMYELIGTYTDCCSKKRRYTHTHLKVFYGVPTQDSQRIW